MILYMFSSVICGPDVKQVEDSQVSRNGEAWVPGSLLDTLLTHIALGLEQETIYKEFREGFVVASLLQAPAGTTSLCAHLPAECLANSRYSINM